MSAIANKANRSTVRVWVKHTLTQDACDALVTRLEGGGIPVGGYSTADGGKTVMFVILPKKGASSITLNKVDHAINATKEDTVKIFRIFHDAGVRHLELPKDGS